MKKLIFFFILILFMLGGCTTAVDNGKINVVTTTGMIADIVVNVGGEAVSVQSLMGPGVDPHLYIPSAADISKLENADVVFYNGLHLEGKMIEVFESLDDRGKPTFAVSENISKSELIATDSEAGSFDPHIWFNLKLWQQAAILVADKMALEYPDKTDLFAANLDKYLTEIQELDSWVRNEVSKVPVESRVLVTAHDAFSYFGKEYGFRVQGIQGISTASEYGLKDLENIIDLIVEQKIKAVFVESSVSPKSVEALKEGVRSKDWEVSIGGTLYSDAMGEPGTAEDNYLGMVRHNVNTIVNSLK